MAAYACIVALSLGAAGCDSASGDGETGGVEATVDPAEVQALLDGFPSGFTKINVEARPMSMHSTFDVDVYVLDAWADEYRKVDFDAMGANPQMGEGAMVVKEMFSEGTRSGATVLYKGPSGYDDAFSDWFRAGVDADMKITDSGKLGFCADCHAVRESDDFLWGIELDNRL